MTDPDIRISYGVKELLARIDTRLESIDAKLDSKADQHQLDDVRKRIEALEIEWNGRVSVEKEMARRGAAAFSRREKVIGTIAAIAAVLIQLIGSKFHVGGL